jgi:hypothetical protein
MADRTATDEAIDLIGLALWRADGWLDDDYPEKAMNHRRAAQRALNALVDNPGLLRRLADQKDGGPLFEGTDDELYDWLEDLGGIGPSRVVVYPAPETTT